MSTERLHDRVRFLEYYRDLIAILLQKEFTIRYKNTFLGYVWSVLNPILFALVYLFLFKVILKIQIYRYPLFLVSGVFFWQAFSNSVSLSSNALVGNSSLIKKLNFPHECLVLAGVLNELTHFILSIPVIFFMMLHYGVFPTPEWFWGVPLLLVTQLFLTYGIALIVANCNLFLRDCERLVSILVILWFYVTPILYSEDMVPAAMRWIVYANPASGLVINWRHLFMGTPPVFSFFVSSAAWAVLIFGLGHRLYCSLRWKFAENV